MSKLFVCFLVLLFTFACCQEVNRVRLVNHRLYMHEVIRKVVDHLGAVEWSTLKLPEFSQKVEERFLENDVVGTLNYTHGFVVLIQDLEIFDTSIQQKWTSKTADSGEVEVSATLSMKDVGLGYDIISHLGNADGRYTALVTVPEITVAFFVVKDLFAGTLSANVTVKASAAIPLISVQPYNLKTDIIQSLFIPATVLDYLPSWGDVFKPIALDVIKEVKFPTICYNCPVEL